jgi:type II secretory pathway pseudopilin PulG
MEEFKAQGARTDTAPGDGEQGFMLMGLIVAMAIILLMLGIAASEAAFTIRREREMESARRANQYVRAIRRFYLKNGNRYPVSVEQLENTNHIRYLRQRYVDPLTRKADYRPIAVGQNKTTAKGFFGEPLAGLPTSGLGALAGSTSAAMPAPAGSGGVGGAPGTVSPGGTPVPTDSLGSAAGMASNMGSGLPGAMGPFIGVGSSASGPSILIVNEQTTYESWEFLYDPRVEKLKAAALLNAGVGSNKASDFGAQPKAPDATTNPTNPTNPTPTNPNPTNTQPNGVTPQTQP